MYSIAIIKIRDRVRLMRALRIHFGSLELVHDLTSRVPVRHWEDEIGEFPYVFSTFEKNDLVATLSPFAELEVKERLNSPEVDGMTSYDVNYGRS